MDFTAATNVIDSAELDYGLDDSDAASEVFTARAAHWSAGVDMAHFGITIAMLMKTKGAPLTDETLADAREHAAQPDAPRFLVKAVDAYDAADERRARALEALTEIDPGCTASMIDPRTRN